ncbi:MAG TPA: transcription termination/antitermination NusG family protein [Verrucomicrobiae bacterium]|nr:transcription termination/antitermination NusG family protein [Verrucomicrobiae bacterium]
MSELVSSPPASTACDRFFWFCIKSQPKHEHIAAAHLEQTGQIEAFLPRIRFRRATRQGTVWVTEALFPGYLFGRFNWPGSLRLVQHSRGVRGVVHFGERWPAIPDAVIRELREAVGTTGLRIISDTFSPGDEVEITEGAMRGLRAVVTRALPGRERIAVLMDFLGRQTQIELPRHFLLKEGDERLAAFVSTT